MFVTITIKLALYRVPDREETYGADWAYALLCFCCSALSKRPSWKRVAASSLDKARFLILGWPFVCVLRFIV